MNACWPGSCHDSHVLRMSNIGRHLETHHQGILIQNRSFQKKKRNVWKQFLYEYWAILTWCFQLKYHVTSSRLWQNTNTITSLVLYMSRSIPINNFYWLKICTFSSRWTSTNSMKHTFAYYFLCRTLQDKPKPFFPPALLYSCKMKKKLHCVG